MASAKNRVRLPPPTNSRTHDFSKVGGLSQHIKLLRDLIIVPLLYGDVYVNLNVNAPRGLLFYGPPGTGKTLVAGALANEVNKQSRCNKVTFFQRKGADILDKWVGESERKLRELFDKATRSRPSIIFFDEIDGLAPERSQKNDQVHCSVVATLLALMDGLDNMPGVIVIGATNRIDALDPALRRPGRFDRELYFPLPNLLARREILQVHMSSWKCKPSSDFINRLAELTTGYCGSDLQALCSESVLCCLKRVFPGISKPTTGKVDINVEAVMVDECDFLQAMKNLTPTGHRLGNVKMRRLSSYIKPLLQRQLEKIKYQLSVFLPHFSQPNKKYLTVGNDRYLGRLVLKGSNQQGVNMHIIPALLQVLEHLPSYVLDVPVQFERNIKSAQQNLPSILVMSRIDDWWEIIDNTTQMAIAAMLQDLHAGLPLLIIATCTKELPSMMKDYFYNNSTVVIDIENPRKEEKENFLYPLFYSRTRTSILQVLERNSSNNIDKKVDREIIPIRKNISSKPYQLERSEERLRGGADDRKNKMKSSMKRKYSGDLGNMVMKKSRYVENRPSKMNRSDKYLSPGYEKYWKLKIKDKRLSNKSYLLKNNYSHPSTKKSPIDIPNLKKSSDVKTIPRETFSNKISLERSVGQQAGDNKKNSIRFEKSSNVISKASNTFGQRISINNLQKHKLDEEVPLNNSHLNEIGDSLDDRKVLNEMWQKTMHIVSNDLTISHLELLYDTISACTTMNKNSFKNLMNCLDKMLTNFKKSWINLSS